MQPTNFDQLSNPYLFGLYQFGVDIKNIQWPEIYKSIEVDKSNETSKESSKFIFNNDVLKEDLLLKEETSVIDGVTECFDDVIITGFQAQFPLFFITNNTIKIPSKIEYVLRKYVSRKLLRDIHQDEDVAIELCLLFASQLTSTYFRFLEDPEYKGWKSLRAEYLRDFLSLNPRTYKKVITALEMPTSKGVIIECDHKPILGKKNHYYRLGEAYIGKGIKSYKLKTSIAQKLLNKSFMRIHSKSETNPIIKNLLEFYNRIQLPSIEQIDREADRLIKLNYSTKKKKILKRLGKHSKKSFGSPEKYSFVEDSIKVFKYLTENGILFPEIGSVKNGGRIIDSLALMPSWIRRMIKIKGKLHVEADYSCMHPNLAINLYGGSKEYLTHGDLGLAMDTNVDVIKVEHLSFFNKEVWQMKQSPLYKYYEDKEPRMLKNIIAEKYNSEFKHNITSRRLFTKEVEIMTIVINNLNKEGIYVGYVYDAVFCHPDDANRVKEVMDEVILKFGIKTTAKLSNGKKHNPILNNLKETMIDVEILKPKPVEPVLELKKIDAGLISFSNRIKGEIKDWIKNGKLVNFEETIVVFDETDSMTESVLRVFDTIDLKYIYVTENFINSA
jgi:hypothetical protein